MKLISHRGNTDGKFGSYENEPNYIDRAIDKGFDVEVDVWCIKDNQLNKILFLGHDKPEYAVDLRWFSDRAEKLWIHCKNIEAVEFFSNNQQGYNFFWHEKDTLTLTSKKYIWAYPGKQPISNSIAVLPEIYDDNVNECIGICSDHVARYRSK